MDKNDLVQNQTNRHTKPLTEFSSASNRFNIRLSTLLSVTFAGLGLVITLISLGIYRLQVEKQILTGVGQRLYDLVAIAALEQDGDAFVQINSADDPEYAQIHNQNTKYMNIDPNIAYIYTMRKDEDGIYKPAMLEFIKKLEY